MMLDYIVKGYNMLRTLFMSYFVGNLLNFFTLTLMYNYLNIKTQPSFCHNFIEKLSQMLYLQNSLSSTLNKFTKNSKFE